MTLVEKFDTALKKSLSDSNSGYKIGDKSYNVYQSNADWRDFINEMKGLYPDAYKQYGEGGGSELEEIRGNPPKMASYASSSRMIYLLARKRAYFEFEKQLATTAGGTANLDGYLSCKESHIFVEAKCHEPYNHASAVIVGKKYEKLYEYINKKCGTALKIIMSKSKKDTDMKTEFSCKGATIDTFDLKQMISHLCGIATACIKGDYCDKSIRFLYLLYNPAKITADTEILNVYNGTCNQCSMIDFKCLFAIVVDGLVNEYKLKPLHNNLDFAKNNFTFELCDQNEFKKIIF